MSWQAEMKVVGILAINNRRGRLNIWCPWANGRPIGNGRFVGAPREFLTMRSCVHAIVIECLVARGLLTPLSKQPAAGEMCLKLTLPRPIRHPFRKQYARPER